MGVQFGIDTSSANDTVNGSVGYHDLFSQGNAQGSFSNAQRGHQPILGRPIRDSKQETARAADAHAYAARLHELYPSSLTR